MLKSKLGPIIKRLIQEMLYYMDQKYCTILPMLAIPHVCILQYNGIKDAVAQNQHNTF